MRQKQIILFSAFFTLFTSSSIQQALSQSTSISVVANGKSAYSIVVPQQAPAPLLTAAVELQRDLQEATGVELPLITSPKLPRGAFISLGATPQAEASNINAKQ